MSDDDYVLVFSRAAEATAPFRSRDHQQVSHIYIYTYTFVLLWAIPYILYFSMFLFGERSCWIHHIYCTYRFAWNSIIGRSISFLPVAEVENVPANIGPPDFDCQLNFQGVLHNRYNLSQRTGLWLQNLTFSSSPFLTCIDQVLHGWA